MTLEQFFECLKSQCVTDRIVYLRYKYSWEDEWTYSNEILEGIADGTFMWFNDWNEGQEDVEVLGFISIDEVYVPEFDPALILGGTHGKEH